MDGFITVAQTLGVAVACLAFLGLAVWRVTVWFGLHVVKPVADRHVKFLDELTTALASQSTAMQTMSVQQGKNLDGIERIMDRMESMLEKQDQVLRTVTDVREHVQHINLHADSVIMSTTKESPKGE